MIRLIMIMLALPMCVWAQGDLTGKKMIGSNSDARFQASVLVGFNASQIDGDDLAGFNKVGMNVGGQVNIILDRNDWVGRFQPSVGIGFTQLGSAPSNNDGQLNRLQRFNLAYAQIPVMIHYTDQRWVFSAGFAYGRLVNTKFIDSNGLDVTDTVSDNYRKSGASFIGGGTVYLTQNIGVNINWERSIFGINKVGGQVHRLISFKGIYTF